MKALTLALAGLAVLVGGGIVHGLWTDRWRPSQDLDRAAEAVESLPGSLKGWSGREQEQDAWELDMTGAVASYSRLFTEEATGEKVLVILLAGKPARMSVHRPEHCYRSEGYELAGKPIELTVTPAGEPGAPMWTGVFTRDDPTKGRSRLRIFWTWYAGGRWEASANPRWTFAAEPVLYKLYVIRETDAETTIPADPAVRLLGELLPVLNRNLSVD